MDKTKAQRKKEQSDTIFTSEQIAEARKVLDKAVASLGPLSFGQGKDLLLDNLEWLPGVNEATLLLVEAMEEAGNQPTAYNRDCHSCVAGEKHSKADCDKLAKAYREAKATPGHNDMVAEKW